MHRAPAPTLRDDQGLSLVELLVALAVLAIVMPALAATTFSTLLATQVNDQRTVATNLAQSEIEIVRSSTFSELVTDLGRVTRTVSSAGVTYVVARDTSLTGLDATSSPCTGSGEAGDTSLARVDVEVWPQEHPDRIGRSTTTVARPSGDVDDPTRGRLGIQVTDHRDPAQGVAGATVSVTRTSPTAVNQQAATPASGCVIFTNLPEGDYTVTVSRSGYVGRDLSEVGSVQRTASVVAGEMRVPPPIGFAPQATATFGAAATADVGAVLPLDLPVTLVRDAVILRRPRGAVSQPLWPAPWEVYAGDCKYADPASWLPVRPRQPAHPLTPGANAVTAHLGVISLELPAEPTAPITWPVAVTAVTTDCAVDETNTLTFAPVGEAETVSFDPATLHLALPYGTWSLTATDAAGRSLQVTGIELPPDAPGPVVAGDEEVRP
jgi:prepilin-type N-terminal cleavage/methylation domain-containing protein